MKANSYIECHRTGDNAALLRIMLVVGGLSPQPKKHGNRCVTDA